MVKERGKGAFTSLFDLCRRTTDQHVNQRAFEILIDSGACDVLAEGTAGAVRAQLRQCLPEVLRAAEQYLQDEAIGIANLFEGMGDEPGAEAGMPAAPGNQTWDTREILDAERECLGFYLSAHPMDEYLPELANFAPTRLSEAKSSRKNQLLAGMLAEVRVRKRDDGANMGILALDDGSARLEAVMYDPEFKRIQDRLEKYQILIVEGRVVNDDYTGGLRIRAKEVMTLDQARARHASSLSLNLREQELSNDFCRQLATILKPYRGNGADNSGARYCKVIINYHRDDLQGCIMLGPDWAVSPADELVRSLRTEFGRDQVELRYRT